MLTHWHSPLDWLGQVQMLDVRLLLSVMVNRSKFALKHNQNIAIKLDSHKVIKNERSLLLMSVSDSPFTLYPHQLYWELHHSQQSIWVQSIKKQPKYFQPFLTKWENTHIYSQMLLPEYFSIIYFQVFIYVTATCFTCRSPQKVWVVCLCCIVCSCVFPPHTVSLRLLQNRIMTINE